jgi:phosphoglucosamine mutase
MLEGFEQYPQILINVRVKEKPDFLFVPAIASHVEAVEAELEGKGRLLLRYSGTENLARVMIEGPEQGYIDTLAARLADTIRTTIG